MCECSAGAHSNLHSRAFLPLFARMRYFIQKRARTKTKTHADTGHGVVRAVSLKSLSLVPAHTRRVAVGTRSPALAAGAVRGVCLSPRARAAQGRGASRGGGDTARPPPTTDPSKTSEKKPRGDARENPQQYKASKRVSDAASVSETPAGSGQCRERTEKVESVTTAALIQARRPRSTGRRQRLRVSLRRSRSINDRVVSRAGASNASRSGHRAASSQLLREHGLSQPKGRHLGA
jgi:hypothetical protein